MYSSHEDSKKHCDDAISETTTTIADDDNNSRMIYWCIQTQSKPTWGLVPRICSCLQQQLDMDVLDHRCYNPTTKNHQERTACNEIYCRDRAFASATTIPSSLDARKEQIQHAIANTIGDDAGHPTAQVQVHRWYPGVVQETLEQVDETRTVTSRLRPVTDNKPLDTTPAMQESNRTKDHRVAPQQPRVYRRRQKSKSTPIIGGRSLFDNAAADGQQQHHHYGTTMPAELVLENGETMDVCLSEEAIRALREGKSAKVQPPPPHGLFGFVRKK